LAGVIKAMNKVHEKATRAARGKKAAA